VRPLTGVADPPSENEHPGYRWQISGELPAVEVTCRGCGCTELTPDEETRAAFVERHAYCEGTE
jgi:hypothetical protein